MKHITKSECPEGLAKYLAENPDATWEDFKNEDQVSYKNVCDIIKNDQSGICCYCEIDFEISDESPIKDFRVEHLYPKSKTPIPITLENAHLTWSNLLGCCHGGSMNHIDDNRYTAPHLHCDAVKGENIWTEQILNPLKIPQNEKLFTFETNGKIILSDQCPEDLKEIAQGSIDKLNLNEKSYLLKARGKVRDTLKAEFARKVREGGLSEQQALDELKTELALNTYSGMKFYTCKLDFVSY
ncbi:retron system putative HNH endonuclease [Acinetobacter baumannii]|nr:retron system putative HNH endonuclease [Acinetobacter baumannii]